MWPIQIYREPEKQSLISVFCQYQSGREVAGAAGTLRAVFQYNLGCPGRKGQEQQEASMSPRSADRYRSVRVGTSFLQSLARTPIPGAPPHPSSFFRTVTKYTEAMDTCFLLFFIFLLLSLSFQISLIFFLLHVDFPNSCPSPGSSSFLVIYKMVP